MPNPNIILCYLDIKWCYFYVIQRTTNKQTSKQTNKKTKNKTKNIQYAFVYAYAYAYAFVPYNMVLISFLQLAVGLYEFVLYYGMSILHIWFCCVKPLIQK